MSTDTNMDKKDNTENRYPLYPKARWKTKWWVAFAETNEAVNNGAYEGINCRSKRKAISVMSRLMAKGNVVAAYVVKHHRSIDQSFIAGAPLGDGLGCSNWTPHGNLIFVPRN